MKKIFLLLILALILSLLTNISFAQEVSYSFEIGGAFIYPLGTIFILPYGEMSFSLSFFKFLKFEASLDVILLLILPIFSPSGRIILEFPSHNRIPYLGVGVRNFIIFGEEFFSSPYVAEFFVGTKTTTRGGFYFLWELSYLTSAQVFYGGSSEGAFLMRAGLEF